MKTNHKSPSAETYFTWGNKKSKSGDYKDAIADYLLRYVPVSVQVVLGGVRLLPPLSVVR